MTLLERRLYDLIQVYWAEHGFSPSYEILAEGLGVRSKSNVHRLVHAMIAKGTLEKRKGRARSLRCIPLGTQEYQRGYKDGYAEAAAKQAERAA